MTECFIATIGVNLASPQLCTRGPSRILTRIHKGAFLMRVLMTLHHPIGGNSGAPGVTLAIARALEQNGCHVDFYGYDEAFGRGRVSLGTSMQFPARVAMHLQRCAHSYDVIDASTGDAWLWGTLRSGSSRGPALITRSHGLEHTGDRSLRDEIRAGRVSVRRRYYLYHGGFRLWEVARSLQLSDHVILLNAADLQVTRSELKVAVSRSSVIPHGASDEFFARAVDFQMREQITLAFIGSWIERKGISTVVSAMTRLVDLGICAKLLLLGTNQKSDVLAAFPSHVRQAIDVVPSFDNEALPGLLSGVEILLSTSRSEGFPLTLIEGMAAGLAPLTTPAGAAPQIIEHGRNGMLLPFGDAAAFADAIVNLASNRALLDTLRRNARETAARYRWKDIAQQTMSVYSAAIEASRTKALPTASREAA